MATEFRPGMVSAPSLGTADSPSDSSAATAAVPLPLLTEDAADLRIRKIGGGGMLAGSWDVDEGEESGAGSSTADDMAPG